MRVSGRGFDPRRLHKLKKDLQGLFLIYQDDDLIARSKDARIWKFGTHNFCDENIFRKHWIEKARSQMQSGKRVCFVVFKNKKIIGSTSYYEINPEHKKLTIGYTWFHPDYWGTSVNPITKWILFDYAFEILNYHRVEFCVDSLNLPSQNSLAKFGIQQEGILRNDMILFNGRIRDSVIFSVIRDEWEKIKNNLEKFIT